MLYFIVWLLINALGVYVTAAVLPGVRLRGFGTAVLVALLLSVVNALVRPLLIILTLPLTILTLGLFLLVINALMVMLVDALLDGFSTRNFWWALLFSVVLAVVNMVLFAILGIPV